MLKKIASLICPSNKSLARKAAGHIKDGVNGQKDDCRATIAKYATLGSELADTSKTLSDILKDGKVDEMEEETLAALLEPLFAKAKELIGI